MLLIAMFSIFLMVPPSPPRSRSRGYVAVSGDDQQHHAFAIRGERKCARAVKDQIDAIYQQANRRSPAGVLLDCFT